MQLFGWMPRDQTFLSWQLIKVADYPLPMPAFVHCHQQPVVTGRTESKVLEAIVVAEPSNERDRQQLGQRRPFMRFRLDPADEVRDVLLDRRHLGMTRWM